MKKNNITTLQRTIAYTLLISQLLTSCGGKHTLLPRDPNAQPTKTVLEKQAICSEDNELAYYPQPTSFIDATPLKLGQKEIQFTWDQKEGLQAFTIDPSMGSMTTLKPVKLPTAINPGNGSNKGIIFNQLTQDQAQNVLPKIKWRINQNGVLQANGLRLKGGMQDFSREKEVKGVISSGIAKSKDVQGASDATLDQVNQDIGNIKLKLEIQKGNVTEASSSKSPEIEVPTAKTQIDENHEIKETDEKRKQLDQLEIDKLEFSFTLPISFKKIDEVIVDRYKLLFNDKEFTHPNNAQAYSQFRDKIQSDLVMGIYRFIDSSPDNFKEDLMDIIPEENEELRQRLSLYIPGFLAKNKKTLGKKKAQDELLRFFLKARLSDLGLNSGFKIKKLEAKRHANDVYLVSNTDINEDDPKTIDYYAKTFSRDARHTLHGLIDPNEALVYKMLEKIGWGPKCWFLLKLGSTSMGTTSGGNFIVTENLGKRKNFVLASALEKSNLLTKIEAAKENFALQVSVAGIINDLITLHDTFSNMGNYGIVYSDFESTFTVQFIDHLPNANNGKFALMKSKGVDQYSPRASIIEANEDNFFVHLVKNNRDNIPNVSHVEVLKLIGSAFPEGFKKALEDARKEVTDIIDKHAANFYVAQGFDTSLDMLNAYCKKIEGNIESLQAYYPQ